MPGDQLYTVGSDQYVRLGDPLNPQGPGGLKDQKTGGWINNATVVIEKVVDRSMGTQIDASGTLDYVAGSNGVYVGELDATVAVQPDQLIKIHLRADEPGGGVSRFYIDAVGVD